MSISDEYYENSYEKIMSTGAVGATARWTHRSMEKSKPLRGRQDLSRVLEVGAGHGQHVGYVKHKFDRYVQCDLRPTNLDNSRFSNDRRIETLSYPVDATELPFEDNSFDRLIATCLLAHLREPEKALSEWNRVVRPGGIISIYVPCEPGLILRLAQYFLTRPKQRRTGINAQLMHYREHRLSYPVLMTEIRACFPRSSSQSFKTVRFPFSMLSWNFNLWAVVTIEKTNEAEI